MILIQSLLNEAIAGYAEKDVTGLHKAKVGDYIEIGFEGSRVKYGSQIAKVVSNNRLQDTQGNIFNRDGRVFRKRGSWVRGAGTDGSIVSARQITEKEYKDSVISWVNREIQKTDFSKLGIDKMIAISKIIGLTYTALERLK